jgi:antitoxin MazE
MQTKIQKWGNSLAVRIPNALAEETGLHDDTLIEIRAVSGELHIKAIPAPLYDLAGLLEQVSADNLHGEIDTDAPIGSEVW